MGSCLELIVNSIWFFSIETNQSNFLVKIRFRFDWKKRSSPRAIGISESNLVSSDFFYQMKSSRLEGHFHCYRSSGEFRSWFHFALYFCDYFIIWRLIRTDLLCFIENFIEISYFKFSHRIFPANRALVAKMFQYISEFAEWIWIRHNLNMCVYCLVWNFVSVELDWLSEFHWICIIFFSIRSCQQTRIRYNMHVRAHTNASMPSYAPHTRPRKHTIKI